ncbi:unnamed protein product [Rhizoctonia solani]|uniref:Uncharacterized protein n=1 Tax=Rhizoctonia solani TaxID=456999 RepID=A0A8H2WG66_9AGAM|nr:unnamed protein product [Rhizoctonia solani]
MYSRTVGQDLRKLHPKVIEDVTGSNAEKLGSPFMGDGSPRFGIDERFRSPKKRTKSGLRNDASKPNDDQSQELLEYYGHDAMKNNTADYYIEGPPIGTVLSSPGHTQKEMTPSSPKAQSKRRSQYQYTSRTRPGTVKQRGSDGLPGASSDTSDDRTPIARPQTRSSSFVSPPIITKTSVTSLESSTRSEFSDSEQEADESGHLRADVYRGESGSEKGMEGSRTPTSVRFSPQPITYEPNQQIEQAGNMMRTGGPQTK